MVTFRFYVVTLVAVFLAIAIGVVIGSTLIEPTLVENLRQQVETVRGHLDDRIETTDRLNQEISDLEAYLEQSAPFAVDRRLTGVPVLVVAEDGLDGEGVERLVGRLRQSGASAEGIVWLEPSWQLTEGEHRSGLAGLLGSGATDVDELRAEAWQAVLVEATAATGADREELVPDGAVEASTTTAPTTATSATAGQDDGTTTTAREEASTTSTVPAEPLLEGPLLTALEEAGFVRIQRIAEGEGDPGDDVPASEELVIVMVTGAESNHPDDGALVGSLARQQAAAGLPTLVAEIWAEQEDGPERGERLAPVRDDAELAAIVATVDDLELMQGEVAAALGLADLREGVVGHYGYGVGADRVLPPWLGR